MKILSCAVVLSLTLVLGAASPVLAVGVIEGVAFRDLNGNGDREVGDPLLTKWQIELIDSSGMVAQSTMTDGAGTYQFNNLVDGPYVVRQVLPVGMSQTAPSFRTDFIAGSVTGDWGYIDAPEDHPNLHGPNRWGDIAEDANGYFQSPIDLPSESTTDLSSVLNTHYVDTGLEKIFNNGHTIEAEYPHDGANFLEIGGKEFDLLQFHFHTTSEHAIDGSTSPMEAHFVHRHHDGGLAVIGVFLEPGAFNAEWQKVSQHMGSLPDKDDDVVHPTDLINAEALLPIDSSGYFYEGSLTTPPASHPVNWSVFATPVEVSQAQIDAYLTAADDPSGLDPEHDFNPGHRPLQLLNGRQLNELNHEVTVNGSIVSGIDFGVVSEPSSMTLVVLGLIGLGLIRRDKNRRVC